jgi:prepilin-type N-terminal cleavage/methylation domain-containing protein
MNISSVRSSLTRRRNSPRGFTLIEILVVISIIALLAALLLPALEKARRQSKITVCQSTMRQHGILMGMYIGDCKDYLPAPSTPHRWARWAQNNVTSPPFDSTATNFSLNAIRSISAFVDPTAGGGGSCPLNVGGTGRTYPQGFGWYYWLGYLPPVASGPNADLGILECADAGDFAAGGPVVWWRSAARYYQAGYNAFTSLSNQFSQRRNTFANPCGVGAQDCRDGGANTTYGYRGWHFNSGDWGNFNNGLKARASDWPAFKGVVVDFEAFYTNSQGWMDAHGEGLNMLKVDGSAKWTGKNINGKIPAVYYSEVVGGNVPGTGNGTSTIYSYPAGNATARLWRYYETGSIN